MKKGLASLIVLIMILTSIFILSSCKKEEPAPVEDTKEELSLDAKDIIPLEEGNYWKYAGYGNEYAAFEQKVLYRIGGRVQLQMANGGTVMGLIYEIKEDRVQVVYSIEEFYDEIDILGRANNMEKVILRSPLKEGMSWNSDNLTYVVDSLTEVVETPAGTFEECLKISIYNPSLEEKYIEIYYKPGLGMIKQVFLNEGGDIVSILESYELKTAG